MVARGYKRLQKVTGGSNCHWESQGVKAGEKRLQKVTRGYKGFQGVRRGYRGLQEVTGG